MLYKTCAPCHGEKAELTYADKVPPISSLSPTERLEKLKALRAGTAGDGEGYHGMGEVMKGHLVMNDKNLEILNAYIATLSNESAEANATSAPSAEANATSELVSAEANATSAPASAEASATSAVSDAAAEQGALLYKTCAVCHGAKGEKTYAGKVPPIVNLSAAERLEKLQALRDGTAGDGKGYYGMGAVMKGQLRISDDNLVILNNYIETLK